MTKPLHAVTESDLFDLFADIERSMSDGVTSTLTSEHVFASDVLEQACAMDYMEGGGAWSDLRL